MFRGSKHVFSLKNKNIFLSRSQYFNLSYIFSLPRTEKHIYIILFFSAHKNNSHILSTTKISSLMYINLYKFQLIFKISIINYSQSMVHQRK